MVYMLKITILFLYQLCKCYDIHLLSKIAETSINLSISFNTMLRKTCYIKMHESWHRDRFILPQGLFIHCVGTWYITTFLMLDTYLDCRIEWIDQIVHKVFILIVY